MGDYILSCCTTADMGEEFYKDKDIKYLCFRYHIDGNTYLDDLGKTISFKDFYKMIEDGAMPTTSQINETEYCEFFENFLKEGKDIFHVALSSGISGTFNSANLAMNELKEKYPERKIYIVDSLSASSGFGLLVDILADKKAEGMGIDELYEYANDIRNNINQWFFSGDLTSYYRGGRINRASYAIGKALGICPLLCVDAEGKLVIKEKIRTKKKAMQALVNKLVELADNGESYSGRCFISHSDREEEAKEIARLIEEKCKNLSGKIVINSIGAVIGSHTGGGTIALFFEGKKRD